MSYNVVQTYKDEAPALTKAYRDLQAKGEEPAMTTTTIPEPDHDDTVEAHYSGLERPHVCNDGWVSMEVEVLDPETGAETIEEALYLCPRCADR